MHHNNILWLRDLREKYPENFTKAKVLEIGSADIAGTIRSEFIDCKYIGVDQNSGPGVDLVSDAKETIFKPEYFDTLAIFSVFEHDLGWKETLKHNLQWLKRGGICIICFGAEGNEPHLVDTIGWKLVPHQEFLDYCLTLPGIRVVDWFFEEERYGKNCAGAFDVLLQKL